MSKIFHCLTEAEPFSEQTGGAISRWVANVVRLNHDSIVLAPSADESWVVSHGCLRIVPGLRVYKYLNEKMGPLLRWPMRMAILRNVLEPHLQDLRAGDVLWVHNRPEYAAALATFAKRRRAKLVLHMHNSHLVAFPGSVIEKITADCYVFLTHFIEQEALSKFPGLGPTHVTYSGADEEIFFPHKICGDGKAPTVLYVGRLVPEKGVHLLLKALAVLERRQVDIRGVIVGSADFGGEASSAYAEELRMAAPANVQMEGYCSGESLGAKFRSAEIFCIPSVWQEALGLVVVEAMASGLPVVASRSGGIPELLADGGGVLVERGSVEKLADALEQLAADAVLRRKLATEAYRSFQRRFTWKIVSDNYRRVLISVSRDQTKHAEQDNAIRVAPMEESCQIQ